MKILAIVIMALLFCCSTVSAAWIVKWDTVTMYSVSCPQPEPVPDEFGRMPMSNAQTLQACFKTEIGAMERLFDMLEEAEAFVQRGKDSVKGSWNPTLQNFVIYLLPIGHDDESGE